MGGTGFPTLMFLDADGRRLLKYAGPRSAKGFSESLVEVEKFQALVSKAAAGDARAATEVLIRQLQLEWFDFDEARTRAGALEKITSKQERAIAALLVDTEVRTAATAAGLDPAARRSAGEHFFVMWKAKRLPTAAPQVYSFWSLMADFAEHQGDKKLFKKIVAEFDDSLDARYGRALKGLEDRLENFSKG